MEKIVYNSDVDNIVLEQMDIIISSNSIVEDGAILHRGIYILSGSKVEPDAEIFSCSRIVNSTIKSGAKICSSYVEDSVVEDCSAIGPFAHIKLNSKIGKNCRIGNFVEIKNSCIGEATNIAHLAYVGDASVGKNCNIGCGVVFCNFNGETKNRCIVEDDVFIGSNVNLIAPIKLESGAFIAAGSTINLDVNKDEFAIARARQENKKGFDNPYKNRLKNKKISKKQ